MAKCSAAILDHSHCTPGSCNPSDPTYFSDHRLKLCGEETFDDSKYCLRHVEMYSLPNMEGIR